jgi:hypothetical protein
MMRNHDCLVSYDGVCHDDCLVSYDEVCHDESCMEIFCQGINSIRRRKRRRREAEE